MTKTDDLGIYRIANLAPGKYVVQVPSVQATLPEVVATVPQAAGRQPPPDSTTALPAIEVGNGHRLVLGRYATPLPPVNGRASAYPPTFYPAATTVDAAAVFELEHGEDLTGLDLRLEAVPTYTVSGRLDGPPDAMPNLLLRLMPAGLDGLGHGSEAATSLPDAGGAFTFANVPVGSYTLEASRTIAQFESRALTGVTTSLPSAPGLQVSGSSGGAVLSAPAGTSMNTRGTPGGDTYWARVPLTVDGDVADLVVPLRRAATMRGRFVWEGAAPPSILGLMLDPADGNPALGRPTVRPRQPAEDETFTIDGLLPGQYVISGIGGRIKSVAWNGRDYTHRPMNASSGEDINDVVITLTTQTILLSGTVRDDRSNRPPDDPAVIVFPVESELWSNFGFSPARLKAIQTTNAGRYTFQSLPEGEYYAIAVDVEHIDGWKDPAFLKRAAPLATRISLKWGDKAQHDLRVVTIR